MERSRSTFREDSFQIPVFEGPETIGDMARRVLFSETLHEKLALASPDLSPGVSPTKKICSLAAPGRPEHLKFGRDSSLKPSFPRTPAMVEEQSRGVLLHFFANHELLAAELMALALLKFPDAPSEFREGLARTLREEQMHASWYIRRMSQCGVEFGQYPLNRFFWDAVSTMECPLDYVSRLSLTFEQANLDYAHYYAGVLKEAGDRKTSRLLQKIYRDEISHVGYGLKWFRRWKDSDKDDWQALNQQLHFPLSPSRAKGNRTPFNEAGRRAAGFDSVYIQKLELFERSNGRTPNVLFFNPDAENRAARYPEAYHPDKRVQSVIQDLEPLCLFLGSRDDVALLRKPLAPEHHLRLHEAGLVLPEIESLDSRGRVSSENLIAQRKINEIRPWGRSPDLDEVFAPLKGKRGSTLWQALNRPLFSKISQTKALRPWMGESHIIISPEELSRAAAQLKASGWNYGLIKRAFSTAGGGMLRVDLRDLSQGFGRKTNRRVLREGGILLEPAHERTLDFSVQYELRNGQLRQKGIIEQIINANGQYRGGLSFPKFCSGFNEPMARFLMEEALPHYEVTAPFPTALKRWLLQHGYGGPLGVDAYVYRAPNGESKVRIACEVNCRYTMGRVAHELRRKIHPSFGAKLEIVKAAELPSMTIPAPEVRNGRMAGGSLLLTNPHDDSRFAALLSVAKHRSGL
ncbi:MAG: DUF455 family protein [Verrucomicrobiota bacterium]